MPDRIHRTIDWQHTRDELPPVHQLVLIPVPDQAEPSWPAYLDEDGTWTWSSGAATGFIPACWCELPTPPEVA